MSEQAPQNQSQTADEPGSEKWDRKKLNQLIEEANALSLYIARHGDVLTTSENGQPDQTAEILYKHYKCLVETLADVNTISEKEKFSKLIQNYAKLTAITYQTRHINGRTILDSQEETFGWSSKITRPKNCPILIGVLLFCLALVANLIISVNGGISDPTSVTGLTRYCYFILNDVAAFLLPAAWGGIGACVFLMKRISDRLYEMTYEKARQQGIAPRVFVGAMLGVVVVVLLFPEYGETIQVGETDLHPAIAAFVAGLGVKPIYAAFEALSEALAHRIRGGSGSVPK